MDDLTAVEAKIGSPLVAATAAAMTDTTKVYVYTGSETGYTNGNWYYYDGSAWTSGGVYNAVAVSTDTTLTQQGQAADAKKTGDEVSDLKSDLSEVKDYQNITLLTVTDGDRFVKDVGYIGGGSNTYGTNDATAKSLYIPCQPNAEYAVTKVQSARFRVGYTTEIPTTNLPVYNVADNASATSLNVSTGNDAKYLVIFYKNGSDTLSEETIYNSITVTGLFPTADDKYARNGSVRYDIVQDKSSGEKSTAAINIGLTYLLHDIKQTMNFNILKQVNADVNIIRMLSNAAYLTGIAPQMIRRIDNMFNLVENKYVKETGVVFVFPSTELSDFGLIAVDENNSAGGKRGAVAFINSEGHPIKKTDNTDSTIYPVPIPEGASLLYSNNNTSFDVAITLHILKYDQNINNYVRVMGTAWHFSSISGNAPYIFDLTPYTDGTYFFVCGISTADGEENIANPYIEVVRNGETTRAHQTNGNITNDIIKELNITIV